ncbi:MAG: TIGR04086 family membrane protein [Lachnospiraceae bacterium]|nr:TIGR04086 family membrane protein [Lachnospiraceae bacterium]
MEKAISILKKLLFAYIITAVLLMILSFALYKMQLQEGTVQIGIVVIYAVSCFAAGFITGKTEVKKQFLWGLLVGVLYFAVLLAITVLVKHSVEDIMGKGLTTFFICAGSGMLGGMLS